MKRMLCVLFSVAVLFVGWIVGAQTNKSTTVLKANPTQKRSGELAAVANPEPTGPGAIEVDRKMRVSFKLSALGRKSLSRSDFATAEKCFRQALAAYPRSTEAKTGLAQALEGQGRSDEAENAYREAFTGTDALGSYSTFPSDIAALARHGILAEKEGQNQEAIKSYNMARQWLNNKAIVPFNDSFDPKDLPTPKLRAMLEVMCGLALMDSKHQDGQDRSAEALAAFQEAAEAQPNDPRVQFYLGYSYRKTGQFTQAEAAFQKAALLDKEGTVKAASESNLRAVQAHQR